MPRIIHSVDEYSAAAAKSCVDHGFAVYCRVAVSEWRRVVDQHSAGVRVLPEPYDFDDAWNQDLTVKISSEKFEEVSWSELWCPLPDPSVAVWGYALTYPSHQKEVRIEDACLFQKSCQAVGANTDICFRPHLDYELEIGILLQETKLNRFGYLLANDWTDRGIQVSTFDADNMAPGFTAAKSFKGALQVGYLMIVGNGSIWDELEAELRINGALRQHLTAKDCLLRPGQIHNEIFKGADCREWALVLTGTTDGVQFQSPSKWQKISLMVTSGFSKKRAADQWLAKLDFLQSGDRVELSSPMLGHTSATVVQGSVPHECA